MAKAGKVIISCAVTGSIHVPSSTPHLPITPEQIAESVIGAAEAGVAILHLHARDPQTGAPTPACVVYMGLLLGEMFQPEKLSAVGADDGVHEMMISAPPLPFTGTAGAPPGPVAIR